MTANDIKSKYGKCGVVIDTNILLVYVTGLASPDFVGSTKKTKAYSPEDFKVLDTVLGRFDRCVTFPNILTETSNLLDKAEQNVKFKIMQKLHQVAGWLTELYHPTKNLEFGNDFFVLGVTDQVILSCVSEGLVLLSDDFDLGNRYMSLGGKALNFNHLREFAWR